MSASKNNFRTTFNRMRRELGLASGFGFAMSDNAVVLESRFREALSMEHLTATPQRMDLVKNWIGRATMCGGAA